MVHYSLDICKERERERERKKKTRIHERTKLFCHVCNAYFCGSSKPSNSNPDFDPEVPGRGDGLTRLEAIIKSLETYSRSYGMFL